ncbi:MAG: hypothetical protein V3V96_14270 [Acidiferrobacterales bacterium]
MKTVTYKCDRCKKEINHPKEQVWNVAVGLECEPKSPSLFYSSCPRAQWCRRCTEEFRLVVAPSVPVPPLPPPPTIEDLIREIVQQEVEECT